MTTPTTAALRAPPRTTSPKPPGRRVRQQQVRRPGRPCRSPQRKSRRAAVRRARLRRLSTVSRLFAGADGSIEAALAELDMEHYDDEDDEDADAARLFGSSRRPTFYASNAEDPYITLHEEDDEEEIDDFTLRPAGALRRARGRRCCSTDTRLRALLRPGAAGGSHGGRREPPGGMGVRGRQRRRHRGEPVRAPRPAAPRHVRGGGLLLRLC